LEPTANTKIIKDMLGDLPMLAGLPVTSITNSSSGSGYWFSRFAAATANWTGSTLAFVTAVTVVAVWALTGPFFSYSDSWQLVINTGTTIVTFLMVFLIQNTQNRDTKALQIKLSELILALETANNRIAAIEDASPEELDAIQEDIQRRVTTVSTRASSSRSERAR
jgi:low affinity Fe/Cu permease